MRAFGVTEKQLQAAALAVGVRIVHRSRRDRSRFVLRTAREHTTSGRNHSGFHPRYRRASLRTGRTIPGAVCWHGHRDFMRALFALAPGATLETALATYYGAEHFEASYRASLGAFGAGWVGAPADERAPVCDCEGGL